MKTRLTNNIGFKILSVFLAIMLWLIVLNVSDPEKTTTITNIPISIVNEEAVTGLSKVYEVIAGRTATVTVTGPRTIIDSLETSSFKATADLSKLSMTNAVEVEVELNTVSYRSKVDIDVETTMKIRVENLVNKEFVPEVIEKGRPAEGYVEFSQNISETSVMVTAPESVMNTINKVGVVVEMTGKNKDFSVIAQLQAYDNRGNVINAAVNDITFDVESATVDVIIYPVKQIAIKYEINEADYPDAVISGTELSRDYIVITGRENNLEGIKELMLDTSRLEINPDESEYNLTYHIGDLLPDGVYVYGEEDTVSLKVETDAIVEKTFTVPVNDIAIKSLGDGYSAAHETAGSVRYTLRGRKSVLDKFVAEDNVIFVSTKDLTEGDYNLEVKMDLEDDIKLVTPVYVSVKISLKEKPTETETETTSGETTTTESDTSETTSGTNITEENTTNGADADGDANVPVNGGVQ